MKAPKLICIFSVCLLTACAPHKMQPEFTPENKLPQTETTKPGLSAELKPQLSKAKGQASSVSSWEISGAIAARNKQKGWNASLDWLQKGASQYQIRLLGPLGGGTVVVEKVGSVVTYTDGPRKISSHSADELLQKQMGIRLPVHDLYYWVRGLAAPGAAQSTQYDGSGHLVALSQDGYNILYSNYMTVNGVDLPGRIQLHGHGVVIKLVIKHWKI